MKTNLYFKHNPTKGTSETNVPSDKMISEFKIKYLNVERNLDCYVLSFIVDAQELVNKKFFTKNTYYSQRYLDGNIEKSNEVCFIDLSHYNCAFPRLYTELSTSNWTVAYVCKNNVVPKEDEVLVIVPYTSLSSSSSKLFETKEEMEADEKKRLENRLKKNKKIEEKIKATNNGPLSFITPEREIIEIISKTDIVKDAKPGDHIYGEICILDKNGNNILNVSSKYVNYVNVYLNGTQIATQIPMSSFGKITSSNFVLK